jgi:hypothetical protein
LTQITDSIRKLLNDCTEDERTEIRSLFGSVTEKHQLEKEWGIDSGAILDAINRAADITKRGVRGIIAEAIFERDALPSVLKQGWERVEENTADRSYDSHIQRDGRRVRIQIKLQRLEKQVPKRFYPAFYDEELYDVEIQKTRGGTRKKKEDKQSDGSDAVVEAIAESEETRPYKFTDFDILAVNMHPSTKNWSNFRYTVASWLIPRSQKPNLIEIHQPVAMLPNDVWTSDLATCLDWYLSGTKRQVLTDMKHGVRARKKSKPQKRRKSEAKRK